MNYKTIAIGELKPDPEQPRKHINEEAVKEMAVSIKSEGVINPIEVDGKFNIITGELRWQAAKIAGLKEVPVKVLKNLSLKKRHIRQVQENLHHNSMSAYDTAVALDKIRKTFLTPAAEVKKGSGGFRHGKHGVKELHDLLGIPETTISETLDLLGVSDELKEALKDPSFQRTKVTAIKEAPVKYHKKLEHVIAIQKNIPRDTVRHIATALRRADKYGEDDKANKLLDENLESLNVVEAVAKINKIVPDEMSRVKEPADAYKFTSEKVVELMELLDDHPLTSFDDFHRPRQVGNINALGFYLQAYLKGEDMKLEGLKLIG